jgi:hypothetical protein
MYIGTGTTVTFGTSSFTADIIEITPPGPDRESIDITHMGTTGQKVFMPADLPDWGEFSMTIQFDPSVDPATALTVTIPEEITIAFGASGAGSISFKGFMTGYEPAAPMEELMTAEVTVKVSGSVS